ncbi:hypothetical protein Ahy_A01g002000 [Arachis hypogaea]|uniref:Uncharacterized protein n=1 Tax=Arachis hypogaea TaxID=3818 RepID=A0A445EQD6_ARAHY|nr:hypothetical protein Ahy_A01g002000 [Arachis hypogaea]
MPSIGVEPEVIQEEEVEEEVSIGIRNFIWRQEKRLARGQRLLCILELSFLLMERLTLKKFHHLQRWKKVKQWLNPLGSTNIKTLMSMRRDDDMVGTISIIPTKYLGECESNPDEDYDQEDEGDFSFIRIEDEPGFFTRPNERQMSYLRPLHIIAILNGFKINMVLIDGRAAISLLPERMLGKVGKRTDCSGTSTLAGGVLFDFRRLAGKVALSRRGLRTDWLGLSFLKTLKIALVFDSTLPFEFSYDFPTSYNETNDASRTANLIPEAHRVENKSDVVLVGLQPEVWLWWLDFSVWWLVVLGSVLILLRVLLLLDHEKLEQKYHERFLDQIPHERFRLVEQLQDIVLY